MSSNLDWLPAERHCDCPEGSLNCLPLDIWSKLQVPVWHFTKKDVRGEFERYSRRVHPAIFPRVLARRIIETFSHRGEVVLDIFSGVGTTLVSAVELGRHAIGLELNPRFVKVAKRRLGYIKSMANSRIVDGEYDETYGLKTKTIDREVHCIHRVQFCCDARDLNRILPPNSIDLVVTSPPYWDMLKQRQSKRNIMTGRYLKTNYSDDCRDLSNLSTLDNFILEMTKIFYQIHHVLKPGGRFILITGDYRRRGRYIPLHGIYIDKLQSAGLELNNIMIWDRSNEYDIDVFSYPYHFIAANGMIEYVMEFVKC
jgi:DNA modification methylase